MLKFVFSGHSVPFLLASSPIRALPYEKCQVHKPRGSMLPKLPKNGSERREIVFRFQTMLELLSHYSDFLSAQQMETVIRDSALVFVERDYASEQQTRLEFIKKCEYIMEALVSMKEATVHHGIED